MKTCTVLLLLLALPMVQAEQIKTSITVEAVIDTAVKVYVNGNDVTNGSISVTLEQDSNGKMSGITPHFQFIGNLKNVYITLQPPASKGLTSEKNDVMEIFTYWRVDDKGGSLATSPIYSYPVFATLQDVPPERSGVQVSFQSAYRAETYKLGKYSGTYILLIQPAS